LLQRSALLVGGLVLFAVGIILLLESKLGLSPWDVLNQGISRHTPLAFGTANIAVSLLVLATAWRLGARIGPGTLANAVLIGLFIDLLLSFGAVTSLAHNPLAVRIAFVPVAIVLIAFGTALYVGPNFGAGPRDSLMLTLTLRSGWRLGLVRGLLEGGALIAGVILGGTVGIATVLFVLLIGPAIEVAFRLLPMERMKGAK
jgi:uncharacterized membrane protein YczE